MSARLAFLLVLVGACGGGSWQPTATCGREGAVCSTHGDCCSYACTNGACECAPPGEHCLADVACCAGNSCIDEMCVGGCRSEGRGCVQNEDCCSHSCEDGICAAYSSCQLEGMSCNATAPCCPSFQCSSGTCLRTDGGGGECVSESGSCAQTYECCGVLVCNSSHACAACGEQGAACMFGSDCCSGRNCTSNNKCCSKNNEPCVTYADCCSNGSQECNVQGRCCQRSGGNCTVPGDCCTGVCNGTQCGAAPPGGPCAGLGDCDTIYATCTNGICCLYQNQPCTADIQCCGGTCRQNGTCN
jgi:hypothetical protein